LGFGLVLSFFEEANMRRLIALVLFVLLAFGAAALAQGVQTATLTGTVTSADGLSLPGVTVTTTSPALLGPRTTVSDVNGVYIRRRTSRSWRQGSPTTRRTRAR
jgi:hypothetical protein